MPILPEDIDPEKPGIENIDIIKEIDAENEKDFLREIKKKNEGFLVEGLSILQKERIAGWIETQWRDNKTKHQEIEGMKCYPDLGSIEGQVDIVDVFRADDHQQAVADAVLAMALKPRAVWFQLNAGGFEVEEQIRAEGIACFVASCIRVAWTACQGRR